MYGRSGAGGISSRQSVSLFGLLELHCPSSALLHFTRRQSLSQISRPSSSRLLYLDHSGNPRRNPHPNPTPSFLTTPAATTTTTSMSASKAKPRFEVRGYTSHSSPKPASPSASIIVISPSNTILLLHRVQTSSAFPSAHVFPGGNLEPSDGPLPSTPTDIRRHLDSLAYRTGAIRELFEETGILLARASSSSPPNSLLHVSRSARAAGRLAVHTAQIAFSAWLASISPTAVLDTEGLIPFTHWVTPANVPKRFTTQMYVYFSPAELTATGDQVETMAPEWARAREWLQRARTGEVILFPPQFLLLYLISEVLDVGVQSETKEEVLRKRAALRTRIETEGVPVPWKDKFISPIGMAFGEDGRSVLALDKPGPELRESGLQGDSEYVVKVRFNKEGPRDVEVGKKAEVLRERREKENKM